MWTQWEESGSRVRVLGELIYSCYAQTFPQCSLQEVQGHHLLEFRLHLGLIAKACQTCSSNKTKWTDLADDDAFYAFCASASSLLRHLEPLLPPRPHPQ
jgi:hypothetical protein